MSDNKEGERIDISAALTTTKSTIFSVPTGYILEIDEIVIQQGGTAGTTTLTDEGKDRGGNVYSKTVHAEYLGADGFDDTKDMNVRVFADLDGVLDAGSSTIIVKGRLI